jgi:hypothetical protein
MTRDSESLLVGFCVEQRHCFDSTAWVEFSAVSRLELASAARFLAGVAWYGRQEALIGIADRLSPKSFSTLAIETGFDPSRFAGLLKAHLRHAGQSVAA